MNYQFGGQFLGTTMLQSYDTIGGARSVFVKLRGVKNDLVFPTHGGKLANPFKGKAKIFAGDLFEYRPDANGQNPTIYLLKTYKVKSQDGKKVVIYKDGYKHIPFVGDVLMKAPDVLGGTGKAYTVTAITINANGNWELTFSTAIDTVTDGDVLVEAVEASATGEMLVKRVNAVAPCDYDCFYEPSLSNDDIDNARYFLTPALEATAYIGRMSPIPACVLAVNKCDVPGWFRVSGLNAPEGGIASTAALANQVATLVSEVGEIDDEFDILHQNGATAPTTATVGKVGSQFVVTTTGSEAFYICTAVTTGDTPSYTWVKVYQAA